MIVAYLNYLNSRFLRVNGVTMRLLGIGVCVLLFAGDARAQTNDILGAWLAKQGEGKVVIDKCGNRVCVRLVWVKDQIDEATGQPRRDVNNPNPALRNRPLVGITLATLSNQDGGEWKGTIYNPRDGQTYSGSAELTGDGRLQLKGCALAGLMCDSETWTRVK